MKPSSTFNPNFSHEERGGITILLALILLSAMTVATFGLSRNTLREIAITGNESIGRKAFESADSGIDWTITWSDKFGTPVTPAQLAIRQAYIDVNDSLDDPAKRTAANTDADGSSRVILLAKDYATDLTPDLTNAKQVSELKPSFDVEVRYLRPVPPRNINERVTADLFLFRSAGRVEVGTTKQQFFSRREAIIEIGR